MTGPRKQTLKTALKQPHIQRALGGLVGLPAGGWGETQQAYRELVGDLPHRAERHYTADELIAAALVLDHAERYQWREGVVPTCASMTRTGPR